MSELLIGCGNARRKIITFKEIPAEFTDLVTLDMDPATGCDVVHNLDVLPYPFADESFSEIHAYEVLEHTGTQGDWRFFFDQFHEFWRILKPNGYLCVTVPMWDSPWAWGDPGHRRVIPKEALTFLDRMAYEQVGRTAMTDYRKYWRGDFERMAISEADHKLGFVLRAVK